MFKIMNNGTGQQPAVSTDTVVQLGVFDNAIIARLTLIYTTFLVNGVLDISKLRHSLEMLIEKDGWNKLGARLRRNEKTGGLEHHIPARFTKSRPAIRFYHAKHHMAIADHAVASKFPVMTTKPAVMVDPNDFQSLWIHSNMPAKLRHYLEKDEPQLGVVFVSFDDATIISLNWPHLLFDALGLGELLHAWSLMLQGRHNEIPKPLAAEDDPLAELGRHPTESHKLKKSQLSWLGLFICFCRTLVEVIFYKQQTRMIYVPGPWIRRLRENASRELANDNQGCTNQFLSEGDVLSAWWAKINIAHYSTGSNKLVHLANALGWRPTLARDLLPSGRPYLSNAVGLACTLIPAKDLLTRSLSYVAWQIRQCITESRQREQVEAYAALWRKSPGRISPLFGNSTMHIVTCSNWSKADLFHLDFSAALAERSTTVSSTELGRPSYVQNCFRGVYISNVMVIVGKDTHGGYWLTAFTNAKHWAKIEQAIAQIGYVQTGDPTDGN
ncbi:hypothetical protein HIM_12615 [Hirsutella minnesotensis 3608]|uniref:Uncharacterized protein n=1 Tax=Hirsutella minnesotensis 3608 TaxID=1043627 RepID=A0A0F7ZEU4_9HYPO|nr:hypothetical protein HIM_12615 [Hirsutella minnesotensis 3608]